MVMQEVLLEGLLEVEEEVNVEEVNVEEEIVEEVNEQEEIVEEVKQI